MTRTEINKEKQKEIFREQNKENAKKIIIRSIKLIIILAILGFAFFSYTTYISTIKITTREYRIVNQNIPNNFNGLKIVQFSDLHYGSTMFEDNMKKITQLINEREPDLIVFTGDLIDPNYTISQKEKEKLLSYLKSFQARLGKYAILGDEDTDETNSILNQSEFTVLKNEHDLIYNDNSTNSILLIGLSSANKKLQNIQDGYKYFLQDSIQSTIYTIVLIHEPDSVSEIINNYPETNIILAGHSHNGYIRIPFANIPFKTTKGAKKYNQDFYQIGNTQLYISSGLGTNSYPKIRLFCRPSINFYRLSNK